MEPLRLPSACVQVKSYQLESDWIASKMAVTYDRWRRSQVTTLSTCLRPQGASHPGVCPLRVISLLEAPRLRISFLGT